MKVLLKKFKKCHKGSKIFLFITLLIYIISYAFFIVNILKLKGIETGLRIILIVFFTLWFMLYALSSIVAIIMKKKKTFVGISIITYLLIIIFIIGSIIINMVIGGLSSLKKEYIEYATNLITLKGTTLNDSSKIGMIDNEKDIEGNVLAHKLIDKENLNYEIKMYDDYYQMMYDMYSGIIDGLFVSSNYSVTFSQEPFENINDEVKVVYTYKENLENQDNLVTNKKLTEPFTMLIMGVDSENDGLNANQAFNGDTLILVTFNPKTLTATMLSIPRDMYVPIACRNDVYDKINSSAAYGSSCVIDTIQGITDITIDYYLKINFKGVVDLVDALGGVTVDVEKPWANTYDGQVCEQDSNRKKGKNLVCMNPGIQKLNGEQALAYARCRHLYLLSDIDRNRHQQDLIVAMAKELKNIDSLDKIKNILNTVSKNIDSNMNEEQILSFYNVLKDMLANANTSKDSLVNIKKSYLEYYSLPVYLPAYSRTTSALGYYESSMNDIIKMMKVNLELEEEEMVKTFEIDYNEDYESLPVGKGKTDANKLELLPSFIGQTEDYVKNWATSRGISVTSNEADSYLPRGSVVDQSIHSGTFVKNISHIMIYVSNGNVNSSNGSKNEEDVNENDNPLIDNEEDNEKPEKKDDDIIIDNEE